MTRGERSAQSGWAFERSRFCAGLVALSLLTAAQTVAPGVLAAPPATPAEVSGTGNIVVPFEPTPPEVVDVMLRIADVGPNDVVLDLGSGDGRIPIAAARTFGARSFGVELDPKLVQLSRANAAAAGVADRVTFEQQDIFRADMSRASVVTLFLYRRVNLQLRPALLDLAPGTRIVSHFHDMGEWRADRSQLVKSDTHYGESWVRLWIVPAKIAGRWSWQAERAGQPQRHVLDLQQTFQNIQGSLVTETLRPMALRDARVTGSRLSFWVPIREESRTRRWDFEGDVRGDRILGHATMSGDSGGRTRTIEWMAEREKK